MLMRLRRIGPRVGAFVSAVRWVRPLPAHPLRC